MNIVLSGVGGQGIVLASKLIAKAAMNAGKRVRTAETIGMAQRGGCVVSHVRIGDSYSPIVPLGEADTLIGFEPFEAARALAYLKEGGTVVVSSRAIMPVTASLGMQTLDAEKALEFLRHNARVVVVDAQKAQELYGAKTLNMALLGAAARDNALPVGIQEIECAIRESVKPQFVKMNIKALHHKFIETKNYK
ncbi:MAG: indolepyruvate oxidoreductase subunit beta [Clostridia bacterium]|nr:indolepyruvate oxidoreductase subunit beta [Clostridia bacterium]